MSNDVTTQNQNQSPDPYEEYGNEFANRAHITGKLLRYTKHGDYKAGQDQEEVPEGTRMLVYVPSLKLGWVKWEEQRPVRHIIGLVGEGYRPPPREELGDMDESVWGELGGKPIDPWQLTNYLVMLDELGELYTFVTASKGGLSTVGELVMTYGKRRRMFPDEIPIIKLESRSYNHKDYGETFAPKFPVEGWAKIPENFEQLSSTMGTDPGDGGVAIEEHKVMSFEVKKKVEAAPVKAMAKPSPGRPAKVVATKVKSRGGKSLRF